MPEAVAAAAAKFKLDACKLSFGDKVRVMLYSVISVQRRQLLVAFQVYLLLLDYTTLL